MPFSTPPEVETLAALDEVLHPLGFHVSQQVRVLDVIRAVADNPSATVSPGPTLGDFLPACPASVSGPLRRDHPWLEPDDWRYATQAHFDFLIQEGVAEHPTHPLFAVEFDGEWSHLGPDTRRRDLQKNRLCAASRATTLLRIDYTFLHRREQLSTIEWLARQWAAYRTEMPQLLADRDAEVEAMTEDELNAEIGLLGECPHLDVDFLFQLEHPFPPILRLASRLASRYGFQWAEVDAVAPDPDHPRWRVQWERPAVPSLASGRVERWKHEIGLVGPQGRRADLRGLADVRTCYPLDRARWTPTHERPGMR